MPRVSVICIFLNAERYFAEAIDSVLAQDFYDFELILVDDGSTDGSTKLAKSYAGRDLGQVRYLEHPSHENRGMSATRNLGLSFAAGDYVAFIDSDDRWRPEKLREQVAILDSRPDVDAVTGSVVYWASHEGGRDQIIPTAHVQDRPIQPGEATLALYPLGRGNAPSMSDLLFRRSAIEDVGFFEEDFRGAYEDQAFLSKFYLHKTLLATRSVWSDYRLHADSCMADVKREGAYEEKRRHFLQWFEHHLDENGFASDHPSRRALQRAKRPRAGVLRVLDRVLGR